MEEREWVAGVFWRALGRGVREASGDFKPRGSGDSPSSPDPRTPCPRNPGRRRTRPQRCVGAPSKAAQVALAWGGAFYGDVTPQASASR